MPPRALTLEQRRRVPAADEVVVAVDRAQHAIAEINHRRDAKAASAAHAAELEPEEAARRVELARWADDYCADQADELPLER